MSEEKIEAPITGTVISVEVKPGDKVVEGDVLCYIESMKMENPILISVCGTVVDIKVHKGQVVETGAQMAIINTL